MALVFDVVFLVVAISIVVFFAIRGFIKSVIHFLKTILAFVLAYFLGGAFAALLNKIWIGGAVYDFIYNKINGIYTAAAESFNADGVISSMPGYLMTEEMKAQLYAAEGSGEELVASMSNSISAPIASLISNIIGYIGVFVIALVGLWILACVLTKMVEHIELLKKTNIILGGLVGLLAASIILFVAASLIRFFSGNADFYADTVIVKFFAESPVLKAIKFLNVGEAWFAQLFGK